ncbi:glycosyl hydrolase [Bacillus sp. AFS037270]|uniref:glycosyl hydrolase n=2 Tax=unclassified Bacillus (in: firmicutes) TaxID=185979 RepID=UPI00159B8E22|nr:glycosyl hydrolase [Bacillus sp. AFS037270]
MFNQETFKNPPSSYRIHPFWFWNGDMEDSEITRQITEMADKGVGGFFICPRQGLTVPYLSEEWFQKVKFAAETAKSLDMDVWLYDEYPYPSGMAGGEVTLIHPEAKHYTLVHKSENLHEKQTCSIQLPWGRVLFAKAVPLDAVTGQKLWDESINVEAYIGNFQSEPVFQKVGLTAYNQKRFFTYNTVKTLRWTAPQGKWEIHCFVEEEIDDFKYYGTFVDPCNREAIKTFIELTHERYAASLGEEFGGTVKGIFTDETGLLGKLPWSPQLPAFFKQQNGYEITDYLHALIEPEGEHTAKVRYDYFQAIHLLLRNSYHKQIHDWCEENGVQYVAEVPSVRMSNQVYSHIPGGDSAHEKLGRSLKWILERYTTSFRANPKMVSSLGNQLSRERALIECFHSVGWSMTLQDAKWMLDRLAAFGINFYNFHAFFYTLDGLTKHDAPPSQFLQNPYWEHFRKLGDYAGRLSYVMSCGIPVRQIALLDPTTSLWTQMGNPFHDFHYSGENEVENEKLNRLKEDWTRICKQLLLNHKEYDHLDTEILMTAEVTDGKINIGHASYSVLVLPPITNLEQAAWKKINTFLDQGGVVIANGLLPYEWIDGDTSFEKDILETFGLKDTTYWNYWGGEDKLYKQISKGQQNAYYLSSCELLQNILNEHALDEVKFKTGNGKQSFLLEKRKVSDQSTLVFITNQEEGGHNGALSVSYPCEFQRLDLETGEIVQLQATPSEQEWNLPLYFESYQSSLILINRVVEPVLVENEPVSWKWEVSTANNWEVEALRDNTVRFDSFELILNPEQNGDQTSGPIVQVKTFIDQCSDLNDQQGLPITFHQVFGTPMKMAMKYPISCIYQKEFIVDTIPNRCSILMDRGAISGEYRIFINDHLVKDLVQNFFYDHRNLMEDVQSYLKQGKNVLRIEVKVEHDWDGIVDAIYLAGDFGVFLNNQHQPILNNPPASSTIHQGPYNGYPFYAGTISFSQKIHLDQLPDTEEFILCFTDLDKHIHDCIEVLVNGRSLGVKAWTPYQWEGDSQILHLGENELEVRITNTLIGLLEGKYFDYQEHQLREVTSLK